MNLLIWFDGQIFCSGHIKYAGQPFGLVVANSQHLAHQAALKVKVEYSNVRKPLIDLREVIASGDKKCIGVQKAPEHKPQGKLATVTWVTRSIAVRTYSDTITLPLCWSHIHSRPQCCHTCYITSTSGIPREGGFNPPSEGGGFNPPLPEIPKALQNCAKLNPICENC